jgi:predicted peptidase
VSIASLALVAAACGGDPRSSEPAGAPGGPSSARLTMHPAGTVEASPVGYAEYVPPGYGDGELRPLLVFLHGAGEVGNGSATALDLVLKLGIPNMIDEDRWPGEHPFVVLMPQFASNECAWQDDLDRFVGAAIERYDVDPERIYLTGISCGGIAAWNYLALDVGETVAGAVIVSAQAIDALATAGCDLGRVPVWVIHGALDDVVPVDFVEGQIDELRACDPEPVDLRFTVHPDLGHFAWDPAYEGTGDDDVLGWLLEQRND